MAPQPLYMMELIDLRRADQPDSSRALTVSKLAIPATLSRKVVNFAPGGGLGEIAWTIPQLDPIEPKFELKGYDVDVMSSFGIVNGTLDKWTFAGSIRQKQGGTALPVRAVIEGEIAEMTPDEFNVGVFFGMNFTIKQVTFLNFSVNDREVIYWDFYGREARSNGVAWAQDSYTALGVL